MDCAVQSPEETHYVFFPCRNLLAGVCTYCGKRMALIAAFEIRMGDAARDLLAG